MSRASFQSSSSGQVPNCPIRLVIELDLPSAVKTIRIDPGMLPCITTIKEAVLNGELLTITDSKVCTVNGKAVRDKEKQNMTVSFATKDPNIMIRVSDRVKSTGNAFRITIQTVFLPETMAAALEKELKKKIRL